MCYPKFILDKYIENFVAKKIVATTNETTNNKWEDIIIRLPYIGDITKRLVKQLNKTVAYKTQESTQQFVEFLKENRILVTI